MKTTFLIIIGVLVGTSMFLLLENYEKQQELTTLNNQFDEVVSQYDDLLIKWSEDRKALVSLEQTTTTCDDLVDSLKMMKARLEIIKTDAELYRRIRINKINPEVYSYLNDD